MNILIISQCTKNALIETRRILDHFAERKGDCVWQTDITEQGLQTLRILLKKTAKKNTAVACHWLKNNNLSELIWIVGDRTKFNDKGTVPTNYTYNNILRKNSENNWKTGQAIALLSSISGLFHDFGKANDLFQEKLDYKKFKSKKIKFEPCRHEWVSLRLFLSFITEKINEFNEPVYLTDEKWLQKLANVTKEDDTEILNKLIKDNTEFQKNPFKNQSLPNLARIISWLIVSHHKLPQYNKDRSTHAEPKLENIDSWFIEKYCNNISWNTSQVNNNNWDTSDFLKVWSFSEGTPIQSQTWREKAKKFANRAIKNYQLLNADFLQEDKFSSHISRLCLMLGDHSYSSAIANKEWQDSNYKGAANTNKVTKKIHQKLDEHNIGVAYYSYMIAKSLPKLRDYLPSIQSNKMIKRRSDNPKFQWQDKAYDCLLFHQKETLRHGFFGVNMASTGCGKTLANSKIMFAIADEKKGCRFNVALGLRTLTLQTGDALIEKLKIPEEDIAILIGSQEVKQLYDLAKEKEIKNSKGISEEFFTGSESANYFFEDNSYIKYDGTILESSFANFIKHNPKIQNLIQAPILVTTIDHLIPATEGTKGGKQIAPTLRLLSSDLVLDEPDDFDLQDLPALCRLVNWAGMLGSRVLLSSATIPPDLVNALFAAYIDGRKIFEKTCSSNVRETEVCCVWIDEFSKPKFEKISNENLFKKEHELFVEKRIENIKNIPCKRKAEIVNVNSLSNKIPEIISSMSNTIYDNIYKLHEKFYISHTNYQKKVSIGLIRMANINPLIAVAKNILAREHSNNYVFHFCIYHSQYPMIIRAKIEEELDQLLTRHNAENLWNTSYFKENVINCPEENHVIVIFATSIAEVGRDHDYDWAIIEPSSMRSIIQIAGRVLRHRNNIPNDSNIYILNKNFKALQQKTVCYHRPGFESEDNYFIDKDLNNLLVENDYKVITSIPRIQKNINMNSTNNFIDLEHSQLNKKLFGGKIGDVYAELWWKKNVSWCSELQRRSIFRLAFHENNELFWYLDNEDDDPVLSEFNSENKIITVSNIYIYNELKNLVVSKKSKIINKTDLKNLIIDISEKLKISLKEASIKFTKISLREGEQFSYFSELGAYKELSN
ncbi:type I-F CRISPR-associated helicase Cas3f [Pigmentibacter sp. JX0631]|uniref:type I-F CRISPR-associated helicase Cas3f n=1 Tax=Pigmentibacter sp. JX0631 TaxID=2976982 RepID=UPI0024685F0E|nr:type I-F CRISPR-associated helicase Cas3f [Pigmentibacter sp. JX0631]WGL59724.1 type I-F CRISPR-associated helicase Cas3f [Pigmentibacter sp. JX0631]